MATEGSVIEKVDKPAKGKSAETKEQKEAKASKAKQAREERAKQREQEDAELLEAIMALKEKGVKRSQMPKELGTSLGRISVLLDRAELPKNKRITGDEDELAEKVVKAREEDGDTWHLITVRTGLGHAKVKALYDGIRGKGAAARHRLEGKGGRYAEGVERPEPKLKATGKKAKFSEDMSNADVVNAVNGKTLTVKKGDGQETIKVVFDADKVKAGKNKQGARVVRVTDEKTGNARTLLLDNILRVS